MGAIEVTDLTMAYGELRAVDGVSFEVADGEFFGILGPNGAGKTTTLEIIEGLRTPDAGTNAACWASRPGRATRGCCRGSACSCRRRRSSNGSPRASRSTPSPRCTTSRARGDEWLERVGLVDKADTRVEDLSGGQHQRLSIACALVHDPELVFLDEPTAALDPQARRNLWDLLSGINDAGRTVVLTTHYMDEAEVLCDRVAIMDDGRILELDPPRPGPRPRRPTRITVPGDATADGDPTSSTRADPRRSLTTRAPARARRAQLDAARHPVPRHPRGRVPQLTGREYRA